MAKIARVWNGSAWVEILSNPAPYAYYQTTAPTSPAEGDIWVDSDAETINAAGPQGPTGATGATGAQGPSGVIAVSAPIVNSGTSTSASLSIDSTGSLSIGSVTASGAVSAATGFSSTAVAGLTLSSTTAGAGITIGSDTNIFRAAANTLKTDDTFIAGATSANKDQIQITDTTVGAGITIGSDTNLYRGAANYLKSDDALEGLTVFSDYTTTATAAGTTTLTSASTGQQYFTGTSTQTLVLPVTSTLQLGWQYTVVNSSTGSVTVNSSGANLVGVIPPGGRAVVTCILTSGTTAASWDFNLAGTGMRLIGTATLAANNQTFTISGIPSTYRSLVIYGYSFKSSTTTAAELQFRINELSTTTYGSKVLGAAQTATALTVDAATTGANQWRPTGTTVSLLSSAISGSTFFRLEFPGYSQASGYRHALWTVHIGGTTSTMAGGFFTGVGQSSTAAAISSVSVLSSSATNTIGAGAVLEVYGVF